MRRTKRLRPLQLRRRESQQEADEQARSHAEIPLVPRNARKERARLLSIRAKERVEILRGDERLSRHPIERREGAEEQSDESEHMRAAQEPVEAGSAAGIAAFRVRKPEKDEEENPATGSGGNDVVPSPPVRVVRPAPTEEFRLEPKRQDAGRDEIRGVTKVAQVRPQLMEHNAPGKMRFAAG